MSPFMHLKKIRKLSLITLLTRIFMMCPLYAKLCFKDMGLRLARCFIGVHIFAPTLALKGEKGWIPGSKRRKCEMIRLLNHLLNMPE